MLKSLQSLMTSMRYNLLFVFLLASLVAWSGCDGIANLDVENPNAPDADRAITDPSDLQSILAGAYSSWWNGSYSNTPQSVPQPHLDGWADAQTTTNAFRGFWNVAVDEPRAQFPNTLSFGDLSIVSNPWSNLNSAISSANDVIRQIEENDFEVIIDGNDETPETLAGAYFVRALSYGHLANYFNQAFIVQADFGQEELEALEFSDYEAILAQARSDFDQVRSIAQEPGFSGLDGSLLPFSIDPGPGRLVEMANSFEARFIVSNPRTPAENDAVDWGVVQTLAQNGIQDDIIIELDGQSWFNNYQYISGLYWYWRVDNRIINMMDESYPIKYPADRAGSALDPAQSDDARLCPASGEETQGSGIATARELGCYFVYDTDQSFFTESRGRTLQSNYWYGRDFVDQQWNETPFAAGPSPIFLAEENRLMEAEAAIRGAGDVAGAVGIVNSGSRVNAGQLEPLGTGISADEALKAIYYERDIELYRTGMGLPFWDLRRTGRMQAGTPLHLPVPATELQTIGEELYTFGGVSNAGQPGTASGDNAWCDEGELSCDGPFEAPSAPAVMEGLMLPAGTPATDGRTFPQR